MHLFVISVTLLCNANLIKGENLGSACFHWKKSLWPKTRSSGGALQALCCNERAALLLITSINHLN